MFECICLFVGACCGVLLTSKVFPSDFPGSRLFRPMCRKPGPGSPAWKENTKIRAVSRREVLILFICHGRLTAAEPAKCDDPCSPFPNNGVCIFHKYLKKDFQFHLDQSCSSFKRNSGSFLFSEPLKLRHNCSMSAVKSQELMELRSGLWCVFLLLKSFCGGFTSMFGVISLLFHPMSIKLQLMDTLTSSWKTFLVNLEIYS